MKKVILNLFLGVLLSFNAGLTLAAIDTYQFKDPEKQIRFQKLTNELRCPKCQNQNLADSNAEIASDLRAKIHLMLEENKTNDDIIHYMLERYGEFVLYQPRLSKQTFLLWYAPVLLLMVGLVIIGLIVRFRTKSTPHTMTTSSHLDAEQQQKLAELLLTKK
jgi:cytochrome c-type biogenesis protein CcmH